MSILRKPSENMNVLRYRKLCLSQMDRCVKAVRLEVDSCAERDSFEDGGEIIRYRLEDGFHTFGTSIFDGAAFTRTFTMVYKLRVASKCPCNCSFAKCQVPRCAACKCKRNDTKCRRVIPVRTLVENNGCDKNDTGDSEQSLRCD